MNLETLINPTERQREFLRAIADFDFVLYGGAAGGGKSYILRWWLVLYLFWLFKFKGLRNVQVALMCEDYPALNDRHISKIQFEFPAELGTLRQGTVKDFKLREEFGGGVIALRNLDDPSKYLSAEFAAIAVDELTKNKPDVFDFLRMRMRWPGVTRPKFAGGSNPGGVGHDWVKRLWLQREFPTQLETVKDQFAFVAAKASDNPHLSPAYYKALQTLPPDMAKAYAEGSWDIFAGQYFDIWSEEKHVDRPEVWGMQPWWPRWISIDWGFKHNAAVYWLTSEQDYVDTYREFVASGLSPRKLAEAICERNSGDRIKQIYLSPDAFAKRTDENTIAEQMAEVFREHGLPNPSPADDDRVGGWMLLYQMLESGLLRVGANCPHLIRCIPTLIRDETRIEDVEKMDGDDEADAWRYGVKSMLAPRGKPLDVRIKDRIADFAGSRQVEVSDLDPNQIAMLSRKALHLERKKAATPRWRPGMRRN